MDKKDFNVGQTVCLEYIGYNKTLYGSIKEGIVTKVGRKYITVSLNEWTEYKFEVENNFMQTYDTGSIDYALYLNLQQIEDKKESIRIIDNLKESLNYSIRCSIPTKLTIEQLRAIEKIITERTNSNDDIKK